MPLDFRKAMNTLSDVVHNRPPPLREFDQIYMKVGDLIIQADFIARNFNELDVVFIGDGDMGAPIDTEDSFEDTEGFFEDADEALEDTFPEDSLDDTNE